MATDEVQTIVSMIKDLRIGMLTTHGAGGLLSRPLTVVEVNDEGDLWFFTTSESDVVHEIEANGEVNVSFAGKTKWLSLTGRAVVVRDVQRKKQLYNEMVDAFTSDGPESPNTILLHVNADSAEYWENPGGLASVVTSWIKKKVTGDEARPGTSNTVEL